MSNKDNISATVDPEVAEFLDQEHINISGLVNELVTKYMRGGAQDDQVLEFRIDQVQSEIEEYNAQLQHKRDQLTELKERRSELEAEHEQLYQDAAAALTAYDLDHGTDKAQFWADEAGISVEELNGEIRGQVGKGGQDNNTNNNT